MRFCTRKRSQNTQRAWKFCGPDACRFRSLLLHGLQHERPVAELPPFRSAMQAAGTWGPNTLPPNIFSANRWPVLGTQQCGEGSLVPSLTRSPGHRFHVLFLLGSPMDRSSSACFAVRSQLKAPCHARC